MTALFKEPRPATVTLFKNEFVDGKSTWVPFSRRGLVLGFGEDVDPSGGFTVTHAIVEWDDGTVLTVSLDRICFQK